MKNLIELLTSNWTIILLSFLTSIALSLFLPPECFTLLGVLMMIFCPMLIAVLIMWLKHVHKKRKKC